MEKAVILLSGGLDSTATAAIALDMDYKLYMLHLNYSQRTVSRELRAFTSIADFYRIPEERRLVVDVSYLEQIGGSSLTDKSIPVSEADLNYNGVPNSYVSFRNAHLLAIATSWAETVGATAIFIGAVEQDSSNYPDCRQEFYEAYNRAIALGTKPETHIEIITPVIQMRKSEIIQSAVGNGAPLYLTWSCYQNDGDVACGVCSSCGLRLRGFREIGVRDPIKYEDDKVRTLY